MLRYEITCFVFAQWFYLAKEIQKCGMSVFIGPIVLIMENDLKMPAKSQQGTLLVSAIILTAYVSLV